MSDTKQETIQLKIQPKMPAVLAGFDSKVSILCELVGPSMPTDLPERSPLHLAVVLDKSGSMCGGPLDEAKRCAVQMVEKLSDKDQVSIIEYDNGVNTLVPLQPVSENKQAIIRQIQSIQSGGSTNLFGGWDAGRHQLQSHVADNVLSRVLLLSDGQANVGLIEVEQILPHCQEALGQGVSTSTYGLGRNFNEDLMVEMANSGGGSTYYGATANDLAEPFAEEFDMLNALCAKNIFFSLQSEEHEVKVLNAQLLKVGQAVRTSDLPYESKVWVAFEISVPKALSGDGDGTDVDLGKLLVQYIDLDGESHEVSQMIQLPSLNPVAFAAVSANEEVTQLLNELKASDLQVEASRCARQGDWGQVQRLLDEAKVLAQSNPWVVGVVETLEQLAAQRDQIMFRKEARYSSRSISSKMRSSHEYSTNLQDDDELPSFLRRKTRAGTRRNQR